MKLRLSLSSALLFAFSPGLLAPGLLAPVLLAPGLSAQEGMPQMGPSPQHEMLKRYVGTWSFSLTDHMSDGEPTVMNGVEKVESICGGKWLRSKVHSTNRAFSGLGLTGWDAVNQEMYVAVWIDSWTAPPFVSSGGFDDKTDTLSMRGEVATPDGAIRTRSVTTWPDEDTRVEKIFFLDDDEEELGMELECRRLDEDAAAAAAMPAAPAPGAEKAPAAKSDETDETDETDEDGPESPKVGAHDFLATFAGDWTAQVSMTMPGMPDADPVPMAQTDSLVCDGLWVYSEAEGSFMGMPYEGHGLVGYDTTTDEYVSFWIDNFGAKITQLRGKSDESGKVVTYRGKTIGPQGQLCDTTNIFSVVDADHWTLAMKSVNPDGSDAGTMMMKYARNE